MAGLFIAGVVAIVLVVIGLVLLVRERLAWGLLTLIPGALLFLGAVLMSVVFLPLPGAKALAVQQSVQDSGRDALGSPRDFERTIMDVISPRATSARVESFSGLAKSAHDAFILRVSVDQQWTSAPEDSQRKITGTLYELFSNWSGRRDVLVVVEDSTGRKVSDAGPSGVQVFK